jgi:hypothetical protein
MDGPDFDREQAMREYLATLALLDSEKRAQKRERHELQRKAAQKKRFRAAKRRARQRSEDA